MSMSANLTADLARDLDAAFERVVLTHQDRLFTIALRLLGNASDAEEVAQDAFVRAYRAIATYDAARIRDLQLRPWLTTIVVNLCRNRGRRHVPRLVAIDRPTSERDEGPTPADRLAAVDPAADPVASVTRRESARTWAALVGSLPDRYRTPIVLRHVDGLSYQEMSTVLGRPEGTLKAQVHRGLVQLRDAFERLHGAEREEMSA
jgi:RNA polymerase sigma factor (sigma-70 family)